MELQYRLNYLSNNQYFPFLWTYRSNYLPNLKRELQRSRVDSIQDVLLTVSDLYFCYEVAKAARRALTTLATQNLQVVGRFNSPPPPPPPTDSLPLDFKAIAAAKCSSAPWLARAELARFPDCCSNIGEPFVYILCFRHNRRSKDAAKAGSSDIHVRRRPFPRD